MDKVAEGHLKKLASSKVLSDRNKELIGQYVRSLSAKGTGLYRQGKLAYQLTRICSELDTDLDKADFPTVETALSNINRFTAIAGRKTVKGQDGQKVVRVVTKKPLSKATRSDYRRAIKAFYLWYEDYDIRIDSRDDVSRRIAKQLYKGIKTMKVAYKKDKIDPTQVINEQDVQNIIEKGCLTPKEKAFVALLHETGARVGEILSMKIRHFYIDSEGIGAVFFPKSKTEQRQVDIIDSVGYLLKYKDIHPEKDNPDAPFWYKENLRFRKDDPDRERKAKMLFPLRYVGAVKLVKKCVKRAKTGKKFNLHWFRHSRATLDAAKYPEQVRCVRMGWVPGSKQPAVYTHLSQEMVRQVVLDSKGIKTKKEVDKAMRCPVCQVLVGKDDKYCPNCFRPLSMKQYMEDRDRMKKETDDSFQAMFDMMKNPDFVRKFEAYMKSEEKKKEA